MVTLFTVPKPFEGHIAVIQRNAIRSWKRLLPACQIVLCGDEPGTAAAAAELGAEWAPAVARNELGTPLLGSVFRAAEERALHPLLGYVNADILLLGDFLDAVRRVAAKRRRFLVVGQRWDVDLAEELAFDLPDSEEQLRALVRREGTIHPPSGSDYFVYPRGLVGPLPDFAVGRPGWDNWVIYDARRRHVPVVDVTPSTLVVHQNHDYTHVPQARGTWWYGPEADWNFALSGPDGRLFTTEDATHRLTPARLVPAWTPRHLSRRARKAATSLAPPTLRPVYRAAYRTVRRLTASVGRAA